MNDIVAALGLESWKPYVSVLLLPPVPLLVLILIGSRLMFRRRMLAWSLILMSCVGLWLSTTSAAGKLLRLGLMSIPEPLAAESRAALRNSPRTAIVVLGAGRRELAPEYGMSTLSPLSMERLRYGLWLAAETGLPAAFSGGVGHASGGGVSEAEVAARIAEREFGRRLRWTEPRSRDTVENGMFTTAMLHEAGIDRIVLVSSDFHLPRALRAFRRGAERAGATMTILPAPMGVPIPYDWSVGDLLPHAQGFADTRAVVHEILGYWLGA